MEKYLITYEDAREIAKRYNNNNFWETMYIKNGFKLSTFNYFICGWDDFSNPLPDKPDVNAFDMRGVTFVFNADGSLFRRYLMLPKFFNINQVESTQYGNIGNKTIVNVSVKEDGSLVAFMMLPDGDLFCKTIGSFVSEQADMAYGVLYANEVHVLWVKDLLMLGYTPLFEYVSWDNRIVLKYGDAHLRYIGRRDNASGDFIPPGVDKDLNMPEGLAVADTEGESLDELIQKSKIEEDKEGWVVQFTDGQLIKIKTEWYFSLHGLRTMSVFREDYIIRNYLTQNLDDILSQLNPEEDEDAFTFVQTVTDAVDNYSKHINICTYKLRDLYNTTYGGSDWVEFAKANHKEPFFGLSRTLIEKPEEYRDKRTEVILKRCQRLKRAIEIVNHYK